MKVRVVVTDEDGNTYEGEATLVAHGKRPLQKAVERKPRASGARINPDFSLPVRAFVKRYTKGHGGGQKFAMLLARLSGGKIGGAVTVKAIEKEWNRMTELMGGKFYGKYAQRAKEDGWVDTPKTGHYALRPGWEKALGE